LFHVAQGEPNAQLFDYNRLLILNVMIKFWPHVTKCYIYILRLIYAKYLPFVSEVETKPIIELF
jgi:hypothetical protein